MINGRMRDHHLFLSETLWKAARLESLRQGLAISEFVTNLLEKRLNSKTKNGKRR